MERFTKGIEVIRVRPRSCAAKAGLRPADRLLSLNGKPLVDFLDLRFYLQAGDHVLQVLRGDELREVILALSPNRKPGWELEPLKLCTCRCRCVFCFIDQLPPGLRPTLYLKDEDYRYSFLFGNYLTLVGMTQRDLRRIIELRLSPLYVSIHAANPYLRGKLLGLKSAPILPRLRQLTDASIQLHGQIVLTPGYNDDAVLEDTLAQLTSFYPGLDSLSVAPVGLTVHRSQLPTLRAVGRDDALQALEIIQAQQSQMQQQHGTRWVFPADELLLLAGSSIPDEEAYEEYPQIENGVGLLRQTIEEARLALQTLPHRLPQPRRLIWATGTSARPILREIANSFSQRIQQLTIEVLAVPNRLLGESVTVANLLGGADLCAALQAHLSVHPGDTAAEIYLPPDVLNSDGLFIDDWTIAQIQERIGLPTASFNGDWSRMICGTS